MHLPLVFPHAGSNSGLSVVPLKVKVSAAISFDRYTVPVLSFFFFLGIYSHIFTVRVVQIFQINLLIFYIVVINKK